MKKVLIANRGEIAVRIIRACHDLGLKTVAVYSDVDKESLHVLHANEAICIGEADARKSYLKIANILSACEITGADAVHPGFGFLSENANFASICESCGLKFIGPHHDSISLLGDKASAKNLARSVKCPIIEGTEGPVSDVSAALKEAKKIGFPIFIKACQGGGGKGIRKVETEEEFIRQFNAAKKESELNFNSSSLYIEKAIKNPRHIEIQLIGDKHGNYLHFFERDCSIQRKRQKLLEEAPSPILSHSTRKKMIEFALAIARAAKYYSVGTVEFLVDNKNNFYFLEVNTRIQVEHTVTEAITNTDLIKEQIKIANGEKLKLKQKDISFSGHAIQLRINAEDAKNNFIPSCGTLEYFISPGGPNIRIDTACYSGYKIPPNYDSMIAKLIVHGKDRNDAISIAKRALKEFHIGGINTTIDFHKFLMEDENFIKNNYSIDYIDGLIDEKCKFSLDDF